MDKRKNVVQKKKKKTAPAPTHTKEKYVLLCNN